MGVSREDFVPDEVWVPRDDGWMVPLRRIDDPQRWLDLCRDDDAVVIQVDDGTDAYDGKGIFPTSSSTARWLMARMLDLLDVREGMDVLEIGAGTGYNAAVLAERSRTGQVTTMEVDPAIADHARAALRRTGYPVMVITGDGTLGHPERGPFDRVVATAAASAVPYAWVAQTRPGGRIVLPLAGSLQHGALLSLDVRDDGTAQGRFHGEAAFIRLRSQRREEPVWWHNEDDAQVTTTRRYLDEPFTAFDAGFAVSAAMPDCVSARKDEGGPAQTLLLSHAASGSWASLTAGPDEHEVAQYGPRRLWDEFERACDRWVHAGRPDSTRFGLTVTPEGQTYWLDAPDQPIPPT
jgi:protein-L-isoaspartate(D-aspartate) O-methyltransferase